MGKLEEIKNIEKEIRKTKKFSKLSELLSDMKRKIKESGKVDEEIMVIVKGSYSFIITNFRNFYQSWENDANFKIKDETLEDAGEFIEVILGDLGKMTKEEFSEDIFGKDYLLDTKDFLKTLENKIKEEKTSRQNDEDGGNNPPQPSDDSEINRRISKLQSQINTLEQKQRQNSHSDTSQQDKQELTRLKNELTTLKAKKNQQNSKNPKSNNLPWGMIGCGAIIVILLLVVIFLLGRNSKKH